MDREVPGPPAVQAVHERAARWAVSARTFGVDEVDLDDRDVGPGARTDDARSDTEPERLPFKLLATTEP